MEIENVDDKINMNDWTMTEFEREEIENYNQNAPPIYRAILQQMEDEKNDI